LLSSLSSNRSSILIVAGGGGGASKHSTAGNAGGFTGGSATSYGGATIQGGTQTTGYAFGQGQSITNQKNSGNFGAEGNGGAGGGFFGGYAHNVNGEKSDAGGAGGSGYIGNTKLINKYMACYNCSTSNAEDTKTISSNRVSDRPITGYSKMGNGFARITYIGDDITKIKSDNDNGLVAVTFDPDGGYVSTTEKQYMVGSKYENLPIPRKDGYTFKGWATSFDGYMNLDYIENDGATPIDTLYKPESDDVRYEFKFVPLASSLKGIVGNSSDDDLSFGLSLWNNKKYVGTSRALLEMQYNVGTEYDVNVNTEHVIETDDNDNITSETRTLYSTINGETSSTSYEGDLYKDSSIGIFSTKTASGWQSDSNGIKASKMKLYYLKIYDSENLVRDFIPCIRLSDKSVGFYDKVHKKFYTTTESGQLKAGNTFKITKSSKVTNEKDHTLTALWQ
jgi:hypothetical protein